MSIQDDIDEVLTRLPDATAGQNGGLVICGSNAATTFATLTVSGAVSFGSTFDVVGALSANSLLIDTTTTLTGAVSAPAGIAAAITGNITGNLSGSVGSVTGAVGSVTGAVGSVTGAVGSVTAGVTVTTNNDKTGYSLAASQRLRLTNLHVESCQCNEVLMEHSGYDNVVDGQWEVNVTHPQPSPPVSAAT